MHFIHVQSQKVLPQIIAKGIFFSDIALKFSKYFNMTDTLN